MLTHVDLFAGVGGFALGFERAGIQTLAHVERDEKCQGVLRRHWPGHILIEDVREAGAGNLPAADIITFGSPCQDLSMAGKRKGLSGERSGLFFEAARIIRELGPRYAVWENVPGALSSHNGRDFQSVLTELLGTDVPMPRSGRWATAGMVRTGQKEIAWRVLDAQYFGVAQRRRRIFLVFCPRGDSASQVLFEREGVRWDPPARPKARQGYSPVAGTLAASGGGMERPAGNCNELDICVPIAGTVSAKWAKGTGGPAGDECYNLVAYPINTMAATRPESAEQNRQTFGIGADGDPMFTLQEAHSRAVAYVANWQSGGGKMDDEVAASLRAEAEFNYQFAWYVQGGQAMGIDGDASAKLRAQDHGRPPLVGVRRLTPTECERLQGFPDGWTAFTADGKPQSDSTRYKQMGNAVCVAVAEWLGRRIVEADHA